MAENHLWKLTQKLMVCLVILRQLTLTVLPRLRSLCLLTFLIQVVAPLLLWKLIRVWWRPLCLWWPILWRPSLSCRLLCNPGGARGAFLEFYSCPWCSHSYHFHYFHWDGHILTCDSGHYACSGLLCNPRYFLQTYAEGCARPYFPRKGAHNQVAPCPCGSWGLRDVGHFLP